MVDNPGAVRAKLDSLTEQVRQDRALQPLLEKCLSQVLHCAEPHPEARQWAVERMEEYAASEGMALIARMAHEDPNPENRRAAGMVVVRNAHRMPDPGTRISHLAAVACNERLHVDARAEARRLLDIEKQLEHVRMLANVQEPRIMREGLREFTRNPLRCREARLEAGRLLLNDLREHTDLTYMCARPLMEDAALLRETRVAAAELVVHYFMATERAGSVVAEMVKGGEWPEIAEKTGIMLVDHALGKRNPGEARKIAAACGTPQKVKDYVEMKLGPERRNVTLTGMPALDMAGLMEKPKGVPPAPGKATLGGRPGRG